MKSFLIKLMGGITEEDFETKFLETEVQIRKSLMKTEFITVKELIKRYNNDALERIAFRAECAKLGINPRF